MSDLKRTVLYDFHVAALTMNGARYCTILDDNGSAIDDAFLYRFEEDKTLLWEAMLLPPWPNAGRCWGPLSSVTTVISTGMFPRKCIWKMV